MNKLYNHCCNQMNEAINGYDGNLIEYMPEVRSYSLRYYRGGECTGLQGNITHCPWCGMRLPKKLSHTMEDVLEEEYGITSKDWDSAKWDDKMHLPKEFLTDEWWKKRGL